MSTVTTVPNLNMPNLKIKEFWNKGEGQEREQDKLQRTFQLQ